MWSGRSLLNLWTLEASRKFSCGSGILLGSVLFAKDQEADDKKWTVEYPVKASKGDVALSRKIVSTADKTGLDLRLYQYQTCPYCCKVRAIFDYYGLSYEVVEVNPVTRSQLNFSPSYKKVPVLRSSCCDEPIIESSLIASALATYLHRKSLSFQEAVELYPRVTEKDDMKVRVKSVTFPNKFIVHLNEKDTTIAGHNAYKELQNVREEREWREWVDEHFIHLISPNVYRTWTESLETFRYFDSVGEWERNFPAWERYLAIYVGAAVMFRISKMLKKRHNIDDERAAMRDAFEKFLEAKGPHRRFLGGDEPNLADLSLFGAINSFAGCSAFNEMCNATQIGTWYEDVKYAVEEHRGAALLAAKCAAIEATAKK